MVDNSSGVDSNADLKTRAARWIFGQEANTVALFAILAFMCYAAYYTLTIGIPAHISQIQAGYKSINDENLKSREEDRKSREEDRAQHEKNLDRLEKALTIIRKPE